MALQYSLALTIFIIFLSLVWLLKKVVHLISGAKAKLEKIHIKMDKILESIIHDHRENQRSASAEQDDLVDVLLGLQQSGTLEFPISTTTSRPSFVIKETLRLHPPGALLLPRECREPCEIDGYVIPVKTKVMINAWAIGRDPAFWHDAESFIPERFVGSSIDFKGTSFEYVPFGAGRRMCPGVSFGLANIELPLAQLLYQFDWELSGKMKPEDLDMIEAFATAIRRKNNLRLIPTSYSPLLAL
ncbi:hypothetical protein SLA2020_451930 [Shorea laevis]